MLIVKPGMSPEYYDFCEMLARSNQVSILFDRRRGERRRAQRSYWGVERRSGVDRRTARPHVDAGTNVLLTRIDDRGAPLFSPDALAQVRGAVLERAQALAAGQRSAEMGLPEHQQPRAVDTSRSNGDLRR